MTRSRDLSEFGLLEAQELTNQGRYWYLASPYTKYTDHDYAFREIARCAGWLLRRKVHTFCPITHSHPISLYGDIPLCDHGIWIPADEPILRGACGMIIALMPGWDDSKGIEIETDIFCEMGLPVRHLLWPRDDPEWEACRARLG